MERRLSAIVVADMVGYSRLMEADETGTLKRQIAYRKTLIDPALDRFGGRIVKTTGDGLLAEFPSVVDAVQCAMHIQREIAERETPQPDDLRIQYRIGINLGDVLHSEDDELGADVFGDGVNIAARLENLAEPGGICISGMAYDHLQSKVPAGYQDLGLINVKNIERPIQVWRVLMDPGQVGQVIAARKDAASRWRLIALGAALLAGIAAGGWWWQHRADVTPADPDKYSYALPERPSIAVLPFDNLSGDPARDYIGEGLAENIISTLATEPKLFVIARNSSFHYRGGGIPVQTIAEELSVRYILEGSVQSTGDKIRVTAQLIDALGGHHLWARKYDHALSAADLFEIQDQVTQDIFLAMGVELISGEKPFSAFRDAGDLDTVILLQKAFFEFQKLTPSGLIKSEELARQTLDRNPESAVAYNMLSWVTMTRVTFGLSDTPRQTLGQARAYARKSIELNPAYADSVALLGWLDMYALDYDSALANAARALEMAPGDGKVLSLAAAVFAASGQPERGVELFRQGMRAEPYYPDWVPSFLISSLLMLSQYQEAKALAQALLTRGSRTARRLALPHLAVIAVQEGDMGAAQDYVQQAREFPANSNLRRMARSAYFVRDKAYLNWRHGALRAAGMPDGP